MNGNERLLPGVDVRPDLSEYLTRRILGLIEQRKLGVGDRLPSMNELAQLFEVATPTIREALRRLQAIGVIDIRHGSGSYVKRARTGAVITNPYYGTINPDSVLQLLDARIAIEPHLAGKTAELASADEIESLRTILREADQLLSGQDSKLHPTNMRFHNQIAQLSRNVILSEFFESLVEIYSREQLGILAVFNARSRDYHEHVEILEAIAARDAALASNRMRSHLLGVREVVAQRLLLGVTQGSEPPGR